MAGRARPRRGVARILASYAGQDRDRGFGQRLLALQDSDGQWAGGAFFPAGFHFDGPEEDGQPWTATTWTLNSLREWGLDTVPRERRTAPSLEENSRWEYEHLPY